MPVDHKAHAATPWHAQPRRAGGSGLRRGRTGGDRRGMVALAVLLAVTAGAPLGGGVMAWRRPRIVDGEVAALAGQLPAATATAAAAPATGGAGVVEFGDLLAFLTGDGRAPATAPATVEGGTVGEALGAVLGGGFAPGAAGGAAGGATAPAGDERGGRFAAAAAALVRIERGERDADDEGAVCAVFDCQRLGGFDRTAIRQVMTAYRSGAMSAVQLAEATGLPEGDADALARALDDAGG